MSSFFNSFPFALVLYMITARACVQKNLLFKSCLLLPQTLKLLLLLLLV